MVLHRMSAGDEIDVMPIEMAELEKHAAAISNDSVVLLLVLTSLAFLVPARTSFYLGQLWYTFVFTAMAVICVAYHLFVSDARQWLTLMHHGWAYFCFLQLSFLILGPEDPQMQWIDHPVVSKSSQAIAPPLYAMALARLLPIASISIFLCCCSSLDDFHWQIMILSNILLLFGCAAFWLHRDRRSSIPKVLLRLHFWRRFWNHCGLPGLLSVCIWGVVESTDSQVMTAMWHVLVALLARSIVQKVHNSGADLHREAEILSVSPQNPVIAHILLGSAAIFGIPTLIFGLVLDWWSIGYWRWPLLYKATHLRPGGYLVILGALPTLVAQAASFALISSTVGSQADPQEIAMSKRFGCVVGYVSVAFGLLTLAVPDSSFPTLHMLCMVAALCLMMVATLLTALSTRNPLAPGKRGRCLFTFVLFMSVMGFLMLLTLAQQDTANTYIIPQSWLALSEYVTLVLPMLWPLTWGPEVQARWQGHKVWQAFALNSMSQLA